MKWLIIPWGLALAWWVTAYVALDNLLDASIVTTLPALIAATVSAKVIRATYTYRKHLADQARAGFAANLDHPPGE